MKRNKKNLLATVLGFCMFFSIFTGATLTSLAIMPYSVSLSNDLVSNSYSLTTSSVQDSYNITANVDVTGLTAPILKITIPKEYTLNDYPDDNDSTLSSSYAVSDPFTRSIDENGDIQLIYKWKSGISAFHFSIKVTPSLQKCFTQDYTVTASIFEGTAKLDTASDTVSITNPTSTSTPYDLRLNSAYYPTEATLNGSSDYYVPVGFNAAPYSYYLFDKYEITIPLSGSATPCYKSAGANDYTAFVDGVRTWIETGTATYNLQFQGYVTYHTSHLLDGAMVPVLVLELFPQNSTVDGHYINNASSNYTYFATGGYGVQLSGGTSVLGRPDTGIYEKYANPSAGSTYQPTKSAQLVGYHNNTPFTLYASINTANNYKVTFKNFVWEEHFQLKSANSDFQDVHNSWIHKVLSADNQYYFYSYFTSDIDQSKPATNVQLRITADSRLYCNRIMICAGSSLLTAPTSMDISYKTILGGDTIFTETISTTTYDTSLWNSDALCFEPPLADNDGIVEAIVTLDQLGPTSSSFGAELFRVFLRNQDSLYDGTNCTVSAQILGGNCTTSFVSSGTFTSQAAITRTTTLQPYSARMNNVYITNTNETNAISSLSKGDSFSVVLNNSNYSYWHTSGNFYTEVVNPEYYLLMSKDYVFNGFKAPADWGNAVYTLTTKNVSVDATTASTYGIPAGDYELYAVKYAPGTYISDTMVSKSQLFQFTVGPTKDTSSVISGEKIPVLAGFCNASTVYVDSSIKYQDLLDVNDNTDVAEQIVFKTGNPLTINAASAFSAYVALTSGTLSGVQNDSLNYSHGDTGSALITLYNGAPNTASNIEITCALGKNNTVLGSNTAKWSASLISGASLTSDLSGAIVSYSTDDGINYGSLPANLNAITHVKIALDSLSSGSYGTIAIPFSTAFEDSMTASDFCYIQASITYNASGSYQKLLTLRPSLSTFTGVTSSGYSGVYDDIPHSICIIAPSGASITYGTVAGIYTLNSIPTYKDAGLYQIYYRVNKPGYYSTFGSENIAIGQANQTAPILGKTDETILNHNDATITNVTDKMEYSTDGGIIWNNISGAVLTGLSSGTYHVRYAEDNNHFASTPTEIVIAPGSASTSSGSGSSSSSNKNNSAQSTGTPVTVDGVSENIGSESRTNSSTTISIDQTKLTGKISNATNGSSMVLTTKDTKNVTAQLMVKNIEDMATKSMQLTVQTGNIAYNLATDAIDMISLEKEFDGEDTRNIPFDVTIKNSSATIEGETLVLAPVEFTVTATYGEKTVSIDTFSAFIDRTVEVTSEQAKKITTAVVINPDGTTRHVPTKVIEKEGKYYAIINSRSNSTYAFIQNEVAFEDAKGKWYENVANELASRKIINGRNNGTFDGDSNITRAEFVTILIRSLGLPTEGASNFKDVSISSSYTGAIATATKYGMISGRENNMFDPSSEITREEAMVMLSRASTLTSFVGQDADLNNFSDASQISTWALSAAKWNVGSQLMIGNQNKLRPQENISRGESAALILRLLQKSELIDIRTSI